MNPYTLTLLRHGEVDHQNPIAGQREVALTPHGITMMNCSWQRIAMQSPISCMATSPLARCREFAVQHALAAGVSLKVDARFSEFDFGDWDGQPQNAHPTDRPEWEQTWQGEYLTSPNGESYEHFHRRVLNGFYEWIAASRGCHRILITHGSVITALLTELLQMTTTMASLITVQPGGFVQLSILEEHPAYLLRLESPTVD